MIAATCIRRFTFAALLSLAPLSAFGMTTVTSLSVTQAGSPVTSINSGSVVTLTATVIAGSTPVAPGQVRFCDASATYCTDTHLVGTAQLTSAGTATTRFVPAVGTHSYKAVFVGTNTNAGSTSLLQALAVTQAGPVLTGTTVSQMGGSSGYTLTSTVAQAAAPGRSGPSGVVSFLDTTNGNAFLGSGMLGPVSQALNFVGITNTGNDDNMPILTGDFNGDGFLDVLTQDAISSELFLMLGHGDGTFAAPSAIFALAGFNEFSFAQGDFNGDGKLDVAVFQNQHSIGTILLGNGDGSFTPVATKLPTGSNPASPLVADFNNDGIPDIVVHNDGKATGTVVLGKGDGTFTAVGTKIPDYDEYNGPSGVPVTADFNGDGKQDIVFTLPAHPFLTVLLGKGDGTFTTLPGMGIESSTISAVEDFNSDGLPDLALNYPGYSSVYAQILLNRGDGTFKLGNTVAVPQTAFGPFPGDFNGDGSADLVYAVQDPEGALELTLVALLGDGHGSFTQSVITLGQPLEFNAFPIPGDFNGDGLTDLFSDYLGDNLVQLALNQAATVSASGITVPVSSDQDFAVASYGGDSDHAPSTSSPIGLAGRSIFVSATELTFPPTVLGKTAGYLPVTIINTSAVTLHLNSIGVNVTEGAPSTFGIREQTCGKMLAASAACSFRVAFSPSDSFVNQGIVVINDDASGSSQQIALLGQAVTTPVPQVLLDPSDFTFTDTAVGASSAYLPVVVINNGVQSLKIQSIAITNTSDPYSWGIREQTCGPAIPISFSCSFAVVFRPTRAGLITADVTITDNASGPPQKLTLSGTGKE